MSGILITKQVRKIGKFEIRKALPADGKTPAFLFVTTDEKKIVPHLFVEVQRKLFKNSAIIEGAADELESMIKAIVGNVINDLYSDAAEEVEADDA